MRVWVRSIYTVLIFGGFLGAPTSEEEKVAHWRLKATLGLLTADSDRRGDPTVGSSAEPDDRLEAGIALATWAMRSGVAMIRVHDVRPHVQAARVDAGSIPPAASCAA